MQEGYDTEIYGGGKLSGGEWQRMALARAKFRKRPFIILDEPNAAVDALYENRLYKKFYELTETCTTIIVSHRLSICRLADKIIVMKNGCIVEMGSHKELFNKVNGVYREMFISQSQLYAN